MLNDYIKKFTYYCRDSVHSTGCLKLTSTGAIWRRYVVCSIETETRKQIKIVIWGACPLFRFLALSHKQKSMKWQNKAHMAQKYDRNKSFQHGECYVAPMDGGVDYFLVKPRGSVPPKSPFFLVKKSIGPTRRFLAPLFPIK